MSEASSTLLSQLDERRQEIDKIVAGLASLSVVIPRDLERRMSEISKMSTVVSELAQFNFREAHHISVGMTEVRERLQDGSLKVLNAVRVRANRRQIMRFGK
jgi:methyl-accepting chemotaxis protein